MLREAMEALGVEFHTPDSVERVEPRSTLTLRLRSGKHFEPEAVIVAPGRRGSVDALRLENAGVGLNEQGQLRVNEHFQSIVLHIYAAGDVIGRYALSSMAMEEARMAMVHAFDLKYKAGVGPFLLRQRLLGRPAFAYGSLVAYAPNDRPCRSMTAHAPRACPPYPRRACRCRRRFAPEETRWISS